MSEFANKVITLCRSVAERNLTVGTWGNISLRDSLSGRVFITPSGIPYTDLETSDIVMVDTVGEVTGSRKPSIEMPAHLAIYRARPDIHCVIHTHSLYSTALGVSGLELPGICEDFVQLAGSHAALARYALPGTEELAKNVVEALGDRKCVLMPNHGAIGVGETGKQALTVCDLLEKSARVFVISRSLGQVNVISPDDISVMQEFMKTGYGQ